ncbi:MAG: ribosome maturation factor RimP [Clostridia bacterium]|nr:ribosome maturation factor RimP [Clostridia bacterium]MBR5746462.1 ribosome maturation factor RimP [Clostridia bacterium]
MADRKSSVASRVREAVAGLIESAGYKLWDVDYYKEGPEMILEISIDREGGISLDDCSEVTKLVEPVIDEMDPIEESYCLQVSSAGVVRPLNRDEHIKFVSECGMPVTVGLYTAVDGKKEYSGVIDSYDGAAVTLAADGERRTFEKKQISRITAEFNEAAVEDGDKNEE